MFNNVNQTFNFQDASQEILIMLLGAFFLGCLLTWLLNKLFNRDYSFENSKESQAYHYDNHANERVTSLRSGNDSNADTNKVDSNSDVRIVERPTHQKNKTAIAPDDLSKINHIDKEMLIMLKAYGIQSYAELRDINPKDLKEIQNQQKMPRREIETWPRQAKLAAKGDWKKLTEYQGFISRIQAASNTQTTQPVRKTKPENSDQLAKLEGISPRIEIILNNKEIHTFKQLSHMDSEILKNHIVEADASYADNETESWPHQAAMAEKEQWEELKIYQDFMHSDSDPKILSKNNRTSQVLANQGTLNPDIHSDLLDEATIVNDIDTNLSDHDDLKMVEGIGPKIEELLNNGGIYTFSQLHNSDIERLRKLLDEGGNQFRMHDATTWPHQAGMANRSEWDELKTYKSTLLQQQATKSKSQENDKAKADIIETKEKTNQKDDLKKIEGIGPKIEEVLNKGGINTFEQLYNSKESTLRKLLDEAGSQFRMHDTESWPHQAGMANRSEWSELKSYQSSLVAEKAINAKNAEEKSTEISATENSIKDSKVSSIRKKDDLKKIEGIGPKIEELLNKSGIKTYKQLYNSKESTLRQLLDDAGSQFKMHDAQSWPHQAGMASRSEWDELKTYQNSVNKEKNTESSKRSIQKGSNVVSTSKRKATKLASVEIKDDLRKIEGIGPKIQEMLNNAGIINYKQLSRLSRDTIKELLNQAGPQFRMHEPESWPHQSKLADNKEWDELEKYQNYLVNGDD